MQTSGKLARLRFLWSFGIVLAVLLCFAFIAGRKNLNAEARQALDKVYQGKIDEIDGLNFGGAPIDAGKAKIICDEIISPALAGYKLESVETTQSPGGRVAAIGHLVGPGGFKKKFIVIGFKTPGQTVFNADRLLFEVWALRAQVPDNGPVDALYPAYAAGIKQDRGKLEALGYNGMLDRKLHFRTWDVLQSGYEALSNKDQDSK